MKITKFFNILFCFILLCRSYGLKNVDTFPNGLKLSKVIVVFRHGMRAPLKSYVFDPNVQYESQLWPEGYGLLLTEGKLQMFKLGQQLRTRYLNLLVPYGKSVAEDIKIISSTVDRCYMSAAAMLAGFYPPALNDEWNNELSWQPVPISMNKIIFLEKENCLAFDNGLKDFENKIIKETNYLCNYLSNCTYPDKIDNPSSLILLYDYFNIKRQFGLTLPQWANDDFLNRLDEYGEKHFHYLTSTEKMRRLSIGPLIQQILLRIDDNTYSTSTDSKFYFYAGHDSNLHSLLIAMGFEIDFIPMYGASIIFELYRSSSNNHFIRILYSRNYSLQHLEIKVLPKCEELCPVDKFMQIFNEYIELNLEKECKEST